MRANIRTCVSAVAIAATVTLSAGSAIAAPAESHSRHASRGINLREHGQGPLARARRDPAPEGASSGRSFGLRSALFYGPYTTSQGRVYYPGGLVCGPSSTGVSIQPFGATTDSGTDILGVIHTFYRWNGSAWQYYTQRPQVYALDTTHATFSYESFWTYDGTHLAYPDPSVSLTLPHGYYEIVERIQWYRGATGALIDGVNAVVRGGSGGYYCTL